MKTRIASFLSLAAVTMMTVLGASCVNLMDLNGFSGAGEQLCVTLEQCYGADYFASCTTQIDARLAGADAAAREKWLNTFADTGCLESCEAARACLDESPVCHATDEACGQDEQCCGFTGGSGECLDGACCKPDGIACAIDGDCCFGSCSSLAGGGEMFCGGFECVAPGGACEQSFECCTDICIQGQCSDETCLPEFSACSLDVECCDGFCEGGDALAGDEEGIEPTGTCIAFTCPDLGTPCDDDGDCCPGDTCSREGDGPSVCSIGGCLPPNSFCDPTFDTCCSGFCDAMFTQCTCVSAGNPCSVSQECCGGEDCVNGICGMVACPGSETSCDEAQAPDDPACCPSEGAYPNCDVNQDGEAVCCNPRNCTHSACDEGAPLRPNCNNFGQSSCIDSVCRALPHCCCVGWDAACTAQAKNTADCCTDGMTPQMPMP